MKQFLSLLLPATLGLLLALFTAPGCGNGGADTLANGGTGGTAGDLRAKKKDPCKGHECASGTVCEVVLATTCTGAADTQPTDPASCTEESIPICTYPDPCEGFKCPTGTHCEASWSNLAGQADPDGSRDGAPEAVCVDDPIACETDADCPGDLVCHLACFSNSTTGGQLDCARGEECPQYCDGVCGEYIEPWVDPCQELTCPDGMMCTLLWDQASGVDPAAGRTDGTVAVCIEEPAACETDADCPDSMYCPEPVDIQPTDSTRTGGSDFQAFCQYVDLCADFTCATGQQCITVLEPCDVWPCRPEPTCIDAPEPGTCDASSPDCLTR